MIFSCGTDNRRRLVRAAAGLNGIDYVEAATGNGPDVRRTLLVHFLHPVASVPQVQTWHVDGGERYRGITVVDAQPTTEPNVVRLTTSTIGDLSWYTLRLADDGEAFSPPPPGYYPALAQVAFTFRPGCGDLDCRDSWVPGTPLAPPPEVDYTAKDYLAFRRVLKDRFALTQPGWQGDEPADVRTMLLEVLAYAADRLSYLQDAVATEAYPALPGGGSRCAATRCSSTTRCTMAAPRGLGCGCRSPRPPAYSRAEAGRSHPVAQRPRGCRLHRATGLA